MKKKLNCILLIEDNHFTNIFNKKIIESLDITEQIHIAENGKEGLDYLTNQGKFIMNGKNYPKPDLIFLDINMPVLNGWEFVEEYKNLSIEQKSRILIVMLTTSPNPDDEEKANSIKEVTDYKRKPLTKEMLLDVLKEHFSDYL